MGTSRGGQGKAKGSHWAMVIPSYHGRNLFQHEYREGGGHDYRQAQGNVGVPAAPDRRERNNTTFKCMEMVLSLDSFSFGI